ncbi:hypothetical protein DUI70_4899 [Streptomyces albus]|nr:hypothetical protein DUI70_4899 [Streptomyces albus]
MASDRAVSRIRITGAPSGSGTGGAAPVPTILAAAGAAALGRGQELGPPARGVHVLLRSHAPARTPLLPRYAAASWRGTSPTFAAYGRETSGRSLLVHREVSGRLPLVRPRDQRALSPRTAAMSVGVVSFGP